MSGHKKWSEIKHKAKGLPPALIEFSCRPWTRLDMDGHGDAMDDILDALLADDRALGASGVVYDDKTRQVSTTFQVLVLNSPDAMAEATIIALAVFNDALRIAGLDELSTTGISIVAGGPDDPQVEYPARRRASA